MLWQSLGDGRHTTATPWKRFGNQHSRTFQGRTPETFYDIDCTRSTKIAKHRQSTIRLENWSRWAEYIRQHRQPLLLDTQLRKTNSASIQSSPLSQFRFLKIWLLELWRPAKTLYSIWETEIHQFNLKNNSRRFFFAFVSYLQTKDNIRRQGSSLRLQKKANHPFAQQRQTTF